MATQSFKDENNKVVYLHKRKTDKKVFYVGIGNPNRPYTIQGRTDFWWRIVNKYDYIIEVIQDNLSPKEAQKIEKELIEKYGRRDLKKGYLVNLTDGGDGAINPSKETVEKRAAKLRKAISAYYPNGIHYKDFDSASKASKALNIEPHNITEALKGDKSFAGKLIWCYKNEIPSNMIKKWAAEIDKKSPHIRIFQAFTLEGVFVKEFLFTMDGVRFAGLKRSSELVSCLDERVRPSGKRILTSGGYIWIYSKDVNPKKVQSRVSEYKKYILNRKKHLSELNKNKPVHMLEEDLSVLLTFPSIKTAAKHLSIRNNIISHAIYKQKGRFRAGGYRWKFAKQNDPISSLDDIAIVLKNYNPIKRSKELSQSTKYKPVLQYDLKGNFIKEYKSLSEASKATGTRRGGISNTCSGRTASANGFKWIYKNKIQ